MTTEALETEFCNEPAPAGVEFYRATFGGHTVASCRNCSFTSVYWECGCELSHECESEESENQK
jgi:hypothetical protein